MCRKRKNLYLKRQEVFGMENVKWQTENGGSELFLRNIPNWLFMAKICFKLREENSIFSSAKERNIMRKIYGKN